MRRIPSCKVSSKSFYKQCYRLVTSILKSNSQWWEVKSTWNVSTTYLHIHWQLIHVKCLLFEWMNEWWASSPAGYCQLSMEGFMWGERILKLWRSPIVSWRWDDFLLRRMTFYPRMSLTQIWRLLQSTQRLHPNN